VAEADFPLFVRNGERFMAFHTFLLIIDTLNFVRIKVIFTHAGLATRIQLLRFTVHTDSHIYLA